MFLSDPDISHYFHLIFSFVPKVLEHPMKCGRMNVVGTRQGAGLGRLLKWHQKQRTKKEKHQKASKSIKKSKRIKK